MSKIVEPFLTSGEMGEKLFQQMYQEYQEQINEINKTYHKQDVELLNNFKDKIMTNFKLSKTGEEVVFEFSDGNKLSIGVNCESLDFQSDDYNKISVKDKSEWLTEGDKLVSRVPFSY